MKRPEKKECTYHKSNFINTCFCCVGRKRYNRALDDMGAWHKQALIDARIDELTTVQLFDHTSEFLIWIDNRIAQLKKSMEGMK